MKIEHARSKKGNKWSIEIDPWVERSIALVIATALTSGGGAFLLGAFKTALGG